MMQEESKNQSCQCDLCPHPPYTRPHALRIHKENRHGAIRKFSYHCIFPDCGKIFGERSQFDIHIRAHRDEKKFACIHCELTFSTKANMIDHVNRISGHRYDSTSLNFSDPSSAFTAQKRRISGGIYY